ncbi:MAG: OmpA family protein [Bacteroidota bacterium]
MKKLLPYVFILLTAVPGSGRGKPNPIRPLLKTAYEKYNQGHYFEAVGFYQKVLTIDSTHSDAHYYLAECFRYLFEYQPALSHYQQVESDTDKYPLLAFNLGFVYKVLGNYTEAQRFLQQFIQFATGTEKERYQYWLLRANIELQGIVKAQNPPISPTVDITVDRLPSSVNSPQHDFAAIAYRNPQQMLLTSTRSESKGNVYHPQHGESFSDNFIFSLDSGKWQNRSGTHGFSTINTTSDEGPGSISTDGQTYYFSRVVKGYYQLFTSEFRDGRWREPQLLPQPINFPGYTSKHPAISTSGDTLFFSSDQPGGLGEHDLWMSIREENEWQMPINLGPSVNTPFQETSPYWDSQKEALFFSSNGHPGWGGYDLFVATLSLPDLPSAVANLGRPLNSSYDDTYIWGTERQGSIRWGYITSNRGADDQGFDIYYYQYTPRKNVLFSLNSQPWWENWANQLTQLVGTPEEGIQTQFFDTLPSEEKRALRRAAARRIFQALQDEQESSLVSFEEAQRLTELHGDKLQWLVKSQLVFLQNFQIVAWPAEVYEWYSTLPAEEKEGIKSASRLLLQQALVDQTSQSLVEDKGFQYNLLPSDQQQWLDETTERGVRQFQQAAQQAVDLDVLQQWQTLEPEEKEQLQRQLSIRYFTQVATSDQPTEVLQHQYEQLSPEQQLQIDQLANALLFSDKDQAAVSFNEGSFSLQTYPPEEQKMISQLVVYRTAQMKQKYAAEADVDQFQWETLPSEAKNSIDQAYQYRTFTTQRLTDITLSEEPSPALSLHTILQSNPEVFTLRGKMKMLSPTRDTTLISLGTADNKVSTVLRPNGSFVFHKISYQGSSQLFLEPASGSMSELLAASLKELELTVEQDSQFVEPFDNIYFETNEYDLTHSALPALERVVDFHRQHPDISIQIHAYADSVGSSEFNYQLSKQRGQTVYQYLIDQGVNRSAVKVTAKGKEAFRSSQALAYSRRVEFVITGNNTKYNPTRQVYLLPADPDLPAIASRYGLSVRELMAQNPGLTASPPPYSLIRVITNRTANGK